MLEFYFYFKNLLSISLDLKNNKSIFSLVFIYKKYYLLKQSFFIKIYLVYPEYNINNFKKINFIQYKDEL
jgi:hypothetical protein